uniref:GIY-YIG domain-containing protein n=1 Tax=Panagrolaimus davidi TaxID=227884 RepID=A0A914PFS5_9BILA
MAQESKGEKAVASILGQFRLIKYYRPHSVYAIVDKDGKHKYIGRTNDIDLRMNAHERKSVNPELQVWIKENVHSSKILFTGKADDCARVEALLLHFYFNNKLDNLQLFNKRQEHRQLLINEQYIKVDEDIEIFL